MLQRICLALKIIGSFSDLELERIREAAFNDQVHLYAKGTVKNIRSHLKTYVLFCTRFGFNPLPASSDCIVCFAQFMSQTVSYAYIKQILSSIKTLHKVYKLDMIERDYAIDVTLQCIKRKTARTPLHVFPVMPNTLKSMLLFMDLSVPENLALWTSYLSCFYLAFRKKSICPESMSKFDPRNDLTRGKIHVDAENNVALVLVDHSKVVQFREKQVVFPLIGATGSPLNVVYYLDLLFKSNPADDDAPAFSYLRKGKLLVVMQALFSKKLKFILEKAGFNPDLYSGHSFRRGAATHAYNNGCDSTMIKYLGDWSSDCFLRYVWVDIDQRVLAQRKMIATM